MSPLWLTLLLVTAPDPKLIGTWTLDGQPFMTLEAGGKGSMDGDSFQWSAEGGALKISGDGETESMGYQLDGDRLLLSMSGAKIELTRSGGKSAPAKSTPNAPAASA